MFLSVNCTFFFCKLQIVHIRYKGFRGSVVLIVKLMHVRGLEAVRSSLKRVHP